MQSQTETSEGNGIIQNRNICIVVNVCMILTVILSLITFHYELKVTISKISYKMHMDPIIYTIGGDQ